MEDLFLRGTERTPEVKLSASEGKIVFKGKSIPENTNLFYDNIINWVEQYAKKPNDTTTVKIQMEYFNTMTSKCLHEVLKALETIDNNIEVLWYYEEDDEDMLEVGEDFESIIDLQFKMIEVEEL